MKKIIYLFFIFLLFSCDISTKADISIDGSSTLSPITNAAVEEFAFRNKNVDIAVGTSGTGGGFKKFLNGEIDIVNASRHIKDEEIIKAKENSIEFIEFKIALDGITVAVNKNNYWINDIKVEDLKKLWEKNSEIKKWSDLNKSYPDIDIKFYAPDQDSGTYEYFLEEILGKNNKIRSDYSPASDDNQLVLGVEGDKGAIGFFGYAYYLAQKDKLKELSINGIEPSVENIKNNKYNPLSRYLYIYVNKESLKKSKIIKDFLIFYLNNAEVLVKEEMYVPLISYKEQLEILKEIK